MPTSNTQPVPYLQLFEVTLFRVHRETKDPEELNCRHVVCATAEQAKSAIFEKHWLPQYDSEGYYPAYVYFSNDKKLDPGFTPDIRILTEWLKFMLTANNAIRLEFDAGLRSKGVETPNATTAWSKAQLRRAVTALCQGHTDIEQLMQFLYQLVHPEVSKNWFSTRDSDPWNYFSDDFVFSAE